MAALLAAKANPNLCNAKVRSRVGRMAELEQQLELDALAGRRAGRHMASLTMHALAFYIV